MDSFFNCVYITKMKKKSEHLHNVNYKLILKMNESNMKYCERKCAMHNEMKKIDEKENICDNKPQVGNEKRGNVTMNAASQPNQQAKFKRRSFFKKDKEKTRTDDDVYTNVYNLNDLLEK
ncbi:hypothetical protein RFI_22975 [Reticulomyxa filosa]|uniref:Uncharacterized protein n=1 Tax=Reticulomyxa filosa TaxID=46433 RepID=X6MK84_RETFI|nr:hypothetical protein RFI_22975 [Reticulomyxa filosa]|eukprot:ETO14393.1 hypothetical protein RFI_22975 [Reticulomyxa filosa]